ncbi:MAG: response regulator transcription factor [Acidimicrobiia bacterium]|nr:response regulator transcription factor [Acidimicrobiia bacterium]
MGDGIVRGREAFDRQAWGGAYEHLSAAARDEPLEVEDLERLASAAYLVGRSEVSADVWARAHEECAQIGEVARAARCAFWLAFALLNSGELARGSGWVDRAQRLLDDRKLDCVEQGYLRYAAALRGVFSGDVTSAHAGFRAAVGIGERYRDPELVTLARIGEGRCSIYLGQAEKGVALLDEAMVAVGAREVSPIAMGDAYCTVIEGCHELFDIRRSREWTSALSRWCDGQPELVLYRGECLVHRAEVMQLRGEWSEALDEVERALARVADPLGPRILGAAAYLRGELYRLRGEFADAEAAYRAAGEAGREPQPGVALLRLAEGRIEAAEATIRRVLQEAEDPIARARVLGPYVEIVCVVGDVAAARGGVDELTALSAELNQPFLDARTAHMSGMVLLAEETPRDALVSLRRAWSSWRELEAPHEAARARVLVALACRALGDADGAEMELDAARSAFAALGAGPDLAWAGGLSRESHAPVPGGLTPREVEVLALVAGGRTNRQIADELVISEKTVASHLSHMFTKLGLSSRSAATAYAYEHGLT